MIQKSFTIANLLIVVLGAYVAVGIFYGRIESLLQTQPVVPDFQVQSQKFAAATYNPESHYQIIVTRNLFNLKDTDEKGEDDGGVDLSNMEDTSLNLKLWGTISGSEQEAYAVIEDTSSRQQNLYHKGDKVQGATIKKVMREMVILTFRGKDQKLEMEKEEGSGSGSRSPYSRASASSSRFGGGSMPSQRITLQRSMIEDSIRDINKLMTQVKIMPHLENGRPSGLSVSNIQPNSIFRRMGFRNGDIIMGVDGEQIQSVDDALKLYQNLTNADGVQVQLKRRGRERTLDYSIR